jgi:2-polyprenyl-3-methyl-5-hydroxy-6-metoxy-1,4-benzoquinol methylase
MSGIKAAAARLFGWAASPVGSKALARLVFSTVQALSRRRSPRESLVFLLELEQRLFILTGTESRRYGEGVHSKHRHTGYHDYFSKRVRPGERVLDIGCGDGALSIDLARAGAHVVGIDASAANIAEGRARHAHPNLDLREGDALADLPGERFDVVVMSNVLEHLQDRAAFLRNATARLAPRRWLLRVPMYERDWRVPLMEELGVDYRMDDTHHVEYRKEEFFDELGRAGLRPVDVDYRWGEIWCEAVPKSRP